MGENQFNIGSTIILFGAAQGFFLAFYLFTKAKNRNANKWLGFLIVVVSLHLVEYALNIAGITLTYPGLIATTYPLIFLMGPLYFLYCRSLLRRSPKRISFHFIPALCVFLAMLPFYWMPADQKLALMHGMVKGDAVIIPTEQLVFMGLHVMQTAIYVFLAFQFVGQMKEELKEFSADVSIAQKLDWLYNFSLVFSIYLMLYLLLVVVLALVASYQIQLDYTMLFITVILVYAIGYSAISSPEILTAISEFGPPSADQKGSDVLDKYPRMKETLLEFMVANKPYLKSDLKISELAESIGVPAHQLSQLINDDLRVNFYDFINQYRVEEAKKLLVEDNRNFKILAIAFEVGFNSKATFNRVFKKITNYTPSEFKEKIASDDRRQENVNL